MEYVEHRFGPGETIKAIIRKRNRQNMSKELVNTLKEEYNKLNEVKVPIVGDTVKIPIYDFGNEPEEVFVPTVTKVPIPKPPRNIPQKGETTFIQPVNTAVDIMEEITLPNNIEFVPSNKDEKAMMARQRRREEARKAAGLVTNKPTPSEVQPEPVNVKSEPTVLVEPTFEDVPVLSNETTQPTTHPVDIEPVAEENKPKVAPTRRKRDWRHAEDPSTEEEQPKEMPQSRRQIALRNRRRR